MIFWPAVALLGFFFLAGVIVILGVSSTARYELERQGLPAGSRETNFPRPVGAENHPAGRRRVEPTSEPAWWLVHGLADDGGQVVAGPYEDSIDAEWAALSAGLYAVVRAVHGIPRTDSRLLQRTPPPEVSWLAELGE